MAKFISKCFSEIALLAAAVLWAGCNDVNKIREMKSRRVKLQVVLVLKY